MNVVVETPHRASLGAEFPGLLFGDEPYVVVEAKHLPELLVKCGVYASFSEARRAGRDGPIPPGFTYPFRASKAVPDMAIWNCVEPWTAEKEAMAQEVERLWFPK